MVNHNKHFYQYTKYPHKFKRTYWGNFTLTNNWNNFNEIIENRNNFISKYNIKKRMDYCYCPNYIKKEFNILNHGDHNEIYLTNDKDYVLITSPYGSEKEIDYFYCPEYVKTEFNKLNYKDRIRISITKDKDYIFTIYRFTNNEFDNNEWIPRYHQSPFGPRVSSISKVVPKPNDSEINNEWNPIENLYSYSTTTYMKVIPMRKKL